jgi:peptide/nickel transport system substrate-binding protein
MSVRFPAQVHTSLSAATLFIVLDTEAKPFDDVDVRRAINLAVDRDQVVEILGGEATGFPTCQQLPPNFPGYEPYCPYTMHHPGPEGWTAPNLERAKILIDRSGTAGMPVTFEYTTKFLGPAARDLGDYMVEVLGHLGYQARARSLRWEDLYDPGNEFQIALGAWVADYPSAANFITNQFSCGAVQTPSAKFCSPGLDEMIDRAIRVQVRDPAKSGPLWAAVDRAIVDRAPYVWLASGIEADFVSERVDNYQWGLQRQAVLLEQLWVQ